MMDKTDKIDNGVYLDDDISNTDIKINPDFYIHHALINAQRTFLKENMKEGFLQYILFIEHIETLCRAARFLLEDYERAMEKFRESEEYKGNTDGLQQRVMLANTKLGLMMTQVFDRKTVTDPLFISFKEMKEEEEEKDGISTNEDSP